MTTPTHYASVKSALQILELFSLSEPRLRVTTISQKMSLSKSTVSRLLTTLQEAGFVTKEPGYQGYRLSAKLHYLGTRARRSQQLYQVVRPFLHKLNYHTDQLAALTLLENNQALFLTTEEHFITQATLIDYYQQQGLLETSAGTLLLAHAQEIPPVFLLEQKLRTIRQAPFVANIEEPESPYRSIATPLFNADKKIIGALTVIGPKETFSQAEINALLPIILTITKQTNAQLARPQL